MPACCPRRSATGVEDDGGGAPERTKDLLNSPPLPSASASLLLLLLSLSLPLPRLPALASCSPLAWRAGRTAVVGADDDQLPSAMCASSSAESRLSRWPPPWRKVAWSLLPLECCWWTRAARDCGSCGRGPAGGCERATRLATTSRHRPADGRSTELIRSTWLSSSRWMDEGSCLARRRACSEVRRANSALAVQVDERVERLPENDKHLGFL